MYLEKGNLVVELSIPKVKSEDVELSVEEGRLVVSGKTETKTEVEEEKYYRKEIQTGQFSRVIPLPTGLLLDKAEAEYSKNGILRVLIPKEKEESKKIKQIKVKNIK
ncbi:MAG: HSP20 family protein [Parcubacteria group bacterium Greene0714_2]|nr:MAG: HSP20 family protein [Parcubacteria group bacterium Greene0714_2]